MSLAKGHPFEIDVDERAKRVAGLSVEGRRPAGEARQEDEHDQWSQECLYGMCDGHPPEATLVDLVLEDPAERRHQDVAEASLEKAGLAGLVGNLQQDSEHFAASIKTVKDGLGQALEIDTVGVRAAPFGGGLQCRESQALP